MYTIKIVRGNIVNVTTEAIVNPANNNLMPGSGANKMIFYAAGDKLIEECSKKGYCETGKAVYTSGFNIPAKYIIHAVGPYWHGGYNNEAQKLASCYISIMKIAESLGLKSLAIPALCTGYGEYPLDESIDIAVSSVVSYLQSHKLDMEIWFMCYDSDTLLRYRAKNMEGVNDVSKYFNRKEIRIDTKLNNEEKSMLRKKLFKKEITQEQELNAVNAVLKRVIRKKYPECTYLPAPKKNENITMKTCTKYEKSGPFITMECVQEYHYDKERMQIRLTPYSFVDTPKELESQKKYFAEDATENFDNASESSYNQEHKVIQVANVESMLSGIEEGIEVSNELIEVAQTETKIEDMTDANDELLKVALENTDSNNVSIADDASIVVNDDVIEESGEESVIETVVENVEEQNEEPFKNISETEIVPEEQAIVSDDVEDIDKFYSSQVEMVEEISEEAIEDVLDDEATVEEMLANETVDYEYNGESYELDDVESDTAIGCDISDTIEEETPSPIVSKSNKSENKNSSPKNNNSNKYKKSKKDYRPNYKPDYKKYGKNKSK